MLLRVLDLQGLQERKAGRVQRPHITKRVDNSCMLQLAHRQTAYSKHARCNSPTDAHMHTLLHSGFPALLCMLHLVLKANQG